MTVRTRLLRPFLAAVVATATIASGGGAVGETSSQAPSAAEATTTQETTSDEPGKLLLMLDSSGSMNEDDPSGGTKMDAAKTALTGVVEDLPKDADVGLRVYGAKEKGGKPTKAACADTQLVAPIKPLDRPGLKKTIKGFTAKGETPIAHSLEKGLDDLGTDGKRNIVLVSDGEESCVPDPCPVVKKLVKDGVDLQIDTVGFGVKGKARKQLQCLADAGQGTYYDAEDADELSTSLTKVSQRAVRGFTVDGDPIKTTESEGKAPTVKPGRYTDTISVSDKARYVKLKRTPGSTVTLSLVARPSTRKNTDSENWRITLSSPDGEECGEDRESNLDFFRAGSSITVSAVANNSVTDDEMIDDPCATSSELAAKIEHTEGGDSDLPLQFVYVEEPAVKDASSLPEALDPEEVTPKKAKGGGKATPAVGGGGFGNAATLEPGSHVDTILPGEQLYYRVRVDHGQDAAFTTGIATTGPKPDLEGNRYDLFTVNAWSPSLREITHDWNEEDLENRATLGFGKDSDSLVLGEYVPEVRYRNKDADTYGNNYDSLPRVSLPGYYYFAIGRDGDSDGEAITVEIDVDVNGTVTGKPKAISGPLPGTDSDEDGATASGDSSPTTDESPSEEAESEEGASEDPAATKGEDDSSSLLPWIGGGLLAAFIGLGAGGWFLRRRLAQDSSRSHE